MSRCVIILRTRHASDIIVDNFYENPNRDADEVLESKLWNACLDKFLVSSHLYDQSRLNAQLTPE